jgi:hypothetical protein
MNSLTSLTRSFSSRDSRGDKRRRQRGSDRVHLPPRTRRSRAARPRDLRRAWSCTARRRPLVVRLRRWGAVVGHGQVAVSDEPEPVENEDYASFSARFADAACVGVVQVSRVAAGHPNGLALEVVRRQGRGEVGAGAAGRVPADAERGTVVPARLPTGDHRPRPPVRRRRSADGCLSGVGLGQNEGFVYQARAFLERGRRNRGGVVAPARASLSEGVHNMEILAAVAESAANGGTAVQVHPQPTARFKMAR